MKGGEIMKKLTKLFAIVAMTMSLAMTALPMVALAQVIDTDPGEFPTGFTATDVGLGDNDLLTTVNNIIKVLLGLLGILAVLLILWGGFIWMTAAGDTDKVEKAKKLIISGIIGLVIIFAAYAIAQFVITNLATATGAV